MLARSRAAVVRGAQQLRRDRDRLQMGPRRRPRRRAAGYQTYVLLANPTANAATVTITFLRENGAPIVKQFTVNPRKPLQRVDRLWSRRSRADERRTLRRADSNQPSRSSWSARCRQFRVAGLGRWYERHGDQAALAAARRSQPPLGVFAGRDRPRGGRIDSTVSRQSGPRKVESMALVDDHSRRRRSGRAGLAGGGLVRSRHRPLRRARAGARADAGR